MVCLGGSRGPGEDFSQGASNYRPSMFKQPGGCTLEAFVDGTKVASEVYLEDGPIDLSVPLTPAQVDAPADLRLSSTCSIDPRKVSQSTDDRTLAFILSQISASLPAIDAGADLPSRLTAEDKTIGRATAV